MRSAICLVGVLALVACSDDEADLVDGNLDGSLPDSSIDAARPDAGDAGSDAQLRCGVLTQSYKFYAEGGLSPLRDVYTVTASGMVQLDRLPGGAYMDAGTYSCSTNLSGCSLGLDVGDFDTALSAVANVWGDGTTVYGDDWRPMDGQVTVVERNTDGKKIVIGNPCNGKAGCTPIPADVAQLAQLFNRLRTELPLGQQEDGGLVGSCSP
jgi:hypothetical protein